MYPIIDLHCDLLSYLEAVEGSSPHDTEAIGCAIPHLKAGGVKLQVCALYCPTESGSSEKGMRQGDIFHELIDSGVFKAWEMRNTTWDKVMEDDSIYIVPAIESASVFAEEDERPEKALYRLELLMGKIGKPLYISLTHHSANRFGGGNMTTEGLQPDGGLLLEYLDKRDIAVDLSHTSAKLAHEIFKYISARELEIPLIASHSNFQAITSHARNLPDPYVEYLIKKEGLQGINFIKDFLGGEDSAMLFEHFRHGQKMGARMAFAGDFFAPETMPPEYVDPKGYYFPEFKDATAYPAILKQLSEFMDEDELKDLSHRNALAFLKQLRFFDDKWARRQSQPNGA